MRHFGPIRVLPDTEHVDAPRSVDTSAELQPVLAVREVALAGICVELLLERGDDPAGGYGAKLS